MRATPAPAPAPTLAVQATAAKAADASVFAIEHLAVSVAGTAGPVQLVADVSLDVRPGECVGVVGESGCGKTVSVMAALGLLPKSAAVSGRVRLDGRDLLGLDERRFEAIRGKRIGFIFQDPQSALNPVRTIGEQVVEPLMLHLGLRRRAARERAIELLAMVGIPAPALRLAAYPHELSGGMCQRVMIALALSTEPDVLIADEPTTALDATVQLQVLDLIRSIQTRSRLAVVLITHDLGVVARTCDRVNVLYAGRTVESRAVSGVFHTPWHPYTEALIGCLPSGAARDLRPISGEVPTPGKAPGGCAFHPRCALATAICSTTAPPRRVIDQSSGDVACHHPLVARAGLPGLPA